MSYGTSAPCVLAGPQPPKRQVSDLAELQLGISPATLVIWVQLPDNYTKLLQSLT